MRTIAHRELRNDSSAILTAVSRGETFRVTNRGHVVAYLVPPTTTPLDVLRVAGKVRPARCRMGDVLGAVTPARVGPSTRELMHELRGD